MNPTTDNQALLTKTFLNFTFFLFFFFLPCHLSLPNSNSTFPYSLLLCPTNVQLPVNKEKTIWLSLQSLLSLSISFIYIMQEPQTQSHKAKNPKKKKKKTQIVHFSSAAAQSTKSPNQFSNFSSSVKTQTRNTQTPQAQFLWFSESQITDS